MQLSIKGKQVDIGDALRTHIDTTLPDAIGKYFDNTTDATVTISKDGGRFAADIQVHVSKRVLVHAHGAGNDAYGALEEATEHVTKRLRRYKRRLRDHKGRLSTADALPALQYVLQAEPEPKEDESNEQDEPIIVAEMPTEYDRWGSNNADGFGQPFSVYVSKYEEWADQYGLCPAGWEYWLGRSPVGCVASPAHGQAGAWQGW